MTQKECMEWLESKSWTVVIHGAIWDTYKYSTDDYEFIVYLFRDMDMIVVKPHYDKNMRVYWLSQCELQDDEIWYNNELVVPDLWWED